MLMVCPNNLFKSPMYKIFNLLFEKKYFAVLMRFSPYVNNLD